MKERIPNNVEIWVNVDHHKKSIQFYIERPTKWEGSLMSLRYFHQYRIERNLWDYDYNNRMYKGHLVQ
jgi:hypothetical protein